ncbi:peptidylprolyl isomerase, partial [Sarracenia purpurea var. burkii]
STFSKCLSTNPRTIAGGKLQGVIVRCSSSELRIESSKMIENGDELLLLKRDVIGLMVGASCLLVKSFDADGAGLPPEQKPRLCDDTCEKALEN